MISLGTVGNDTDTCLISNSGVGEKIMCHQPETISNCQLVHKNTNKHSFWEVVLIEYHNWARWSAYVYDGMIPITLFRG